MVNLFKVDFCTGNIIVVEEAYPKVIKEQHMLKISSRLFITCFGNTQPIAKKSVYKEEALLSIDIGCHMTSYEQQLLKRTA